MTFVCNIARVLDSLKDCGNLYCIHEISRATHIIEYPGKSYHCVVKVLSNHKRFEVTFRNVKSNSLALIFRKLTPHTYLLSILTVWFTLQRIAWLQIIQFVHNFYEGSRHVVWNFEIRASLELPYMGGTLCNVTAEWKYRCSALLYDIDVMLAPFSTNHMRSYLLYDKHLIFISFCVV